MSAVELLLLAFALAMDAVAVSLALGLKLRRPQLRDALLARADLPLEVRQACSDRVADAMAHLAVESGWLTPARGERAGREARERATLSLSVGAPPPDVARLVGYLRRNGQLTAGLILRAILSGHMPFAEIALAERMLDELVTTAPPKDREVEAAKARARSAQRYAR